MQSGGNRSIRVAPSPGHEVFDEIHDFSMLCANQGCVECVETRNVLFEHEDYDPHYDDPLEEETLELENAREERLWDDLLDDEDHFGDEYRDPDYYVRDSSEKIPFDFHDC